MTYDQELVQFITTENGDDLIVSFYVGKPQDSISGRSIILMRDKKWEHMVAESDKGVKLCDENFPEDEEVNNNFLEVIRISNSVIEIESAHRRYESSWGKPGSSGASTGGGRSFCPLPCT